MLHQIVCVKQVPGTNKVAVDPVTGVLLRDDLAEDEWQNTLIRALDALYAKADSLSGLVSGEHGIGYAKKEYLYRQSGDVQIRLLQGIKAFFDPNNILNPGKICQ